MQEAANPSNTGMGRLFRSRRQLGCTLFSKRSCWKHYAALVIRQDRRSIFGLSREFAPRPDIIAGRRSIETRYPTDPSQVEIVVEVLSPDDKMLDVLAKCKEYVALGIEQVYVGRPRKRDGLDLEPGPQSIRPYRELGAHKWRQYCTCGCVARSPRTALKLDSSGPNIFHRAQQNIGTTPILLSTRFARSGRHSKAVDSRARRRFDD